MDRDAAQKILALNRQFYQTFAEPFSSTRMRLQPGVRRIIEQLKPTARILDLGCGNGYLASQLARKFPGASYTGLDNSQGLLEKARSLCAGQENVSFHLADLASPMWESALAASPQNHARQSYDTILAFAVLHHIPGAQSRLSILEKVRTLIQPEGAFIHSEWQFLNNPRLRQRLQPWETIGLAQHEVESGDFLLDWRQGGQGLRYVHHFSEDELAQLARESGFTISSTFYADGKEGNLGLYQIWLPG